MYVPKYARNDDPNLIREFIESHPFATLISHKAEMYANHFPFLVNGENGRLTLSSHMARSNPQWEQIDGSGVLLIFQGPHAYISPSFYVNKLNVPTWNYTAVHAYGKARTIHDISVIEGILSKTVEKFESLREEPWKYDLPEDFRRKLTEAIVGFEVDVERIESKFKLSQNRTPDDYQAVVSALSKLSDQNSKELLKYMFTTRPL
jgi:transcriptional regulator